MDVSPSESTDSSQPPGEQKRRLSLRERLAQGLNLIAIAWLSIMLLQLAVLYRYAWEKGLHPKPGAPSSPAHGPWAFDVFLQEGVRSLLNPPSYAFVFALLSLIAKPSLRAGVTLALSIVFCFIAFGYIGLVED